MSIPLVQRARGHGERTAIAALEGTFSYSDLLSDSERGARRLLGGRPDLEETRVAFLAPSTYAYAVTQWAVWRAGGIAVPLCTVHPRPELEYVVEDSEAEILIAHPDFEERLRPIAQARGLRWLSTAALPEAGPHDEPGAALPSVEPGRRAMIVYTSGTASRPKGVVTTHANIAAQIESLVTAWQWRPDDRILLVLPLHHVHGIINVLCCALWTGAVCEMLPGFEAEEVWRRFLGGTLTLFMAVPTIYARLIAAWEAAPEDRRRQMSAACGAFRLMVSGSAALPVGVLEKWREISGHVLLERYGMTEIGMALSNPLEGERRPGHVGRPLPGVEVRRLDEQGRPPGLEEPGEIEVRGPGVFREYWRRPEATAKAFRDGWFRTGDVAVVEDGCYRILGRKSVDIIKTGGYKVSALEIEEVLRQHPAIVECAVVGVPDPEWGERVVAAVVLEGAEELALEGLREWAKERLAAYKVPTRLVTVPELPRNALGKVTKPELVERFQG
ncbi:MAG: acyl-CoA synthetase [Thermoanaerobaculia bacterium]